MNRRVRTVFAVLCLFTILSSGATAGAEAGWSQAEKLDEVAGNSADVNTPSLDGCPIQSPDGRRLYMASNRPGGLGGLDIWVARRASVDAPWGAPRNLGEPVNSAADDFCPTPVRGGGLYFVSREALPGACGMGDIYFTRITRQGWREPRRLRCAPTGPNTALDEQGPSYFEADDRSFLYFSSGSDIFVSERPEDGSFGAGVAVAELNGAQGDIQPNVSKNGTEVVFTSNDPARSGAIGGFDIYTATRQGINDAWSTPVNLGSAVNTAANETRPSLSWDGRQLLFGRAPGPEGMSDIYVSRRQ